MFGLGTQELVIILVIAFFLFGGKKLPEIGAGLGRGLKAFKHGLKEIDTDTEEKREGTQTPVEKPKDPEKAAS